MGSPHTGYMTTPDTSRPRTRHPFTVRKQTSGYNGVTKFIVVLNPGGRRVSVHASITRESAQAHADDLNIGAMVQPHADDPRPYKVRRAEAEAAYIGEKSS